MEKQQILDPSFFGSKVFHEGIMKERLSKNAYEILLNTIENRGEIDPSIADDVAQAMKEWAIEQGATHYTHWFQPLSGVTAEKHDAFLSPKSIGKAILDFSGKELIRGESDASSFPTGGLRATFEARGYTAWDPTSFAFVKDQTLYIPTVFCSYTGEALDNKTPLLRSLDALSREALRILKLFHDEETTCVRSQVGAEQEYFLIDEDVFNRRPDLLYTGRTLFGAPAPKGQQLDDHYFGPLNLRVTAFMHDLDRELWAYGIPAKTKHNETAPGQHELAPVYTEASLACDQNLLMMETMKRVAQQHHMVCLLHEKPFDGINGSGKHNNWSLSTNTGRNLLKPGKTPAENTQFLLFLAAVIRAVDLYQDLFRISVATASNDLRLGMTEAPPAIISVFLGDDLQAIIDDLIKGIKPTSRAKSMMDLHSPAIPVFAKDTTDRNRTSPLAFTGNKFEFRMVGSSQNLSLPNIIMNTAVADSLKTFADELEHAKNFDHALIDLLQKTFKKHKRIIFNGNSYGEEWQKEAKKRGLSCYQSAPEAYAHMEDTPNVTLFKNFQIMTPSELASRKTILFENYTKVVLIEARTMLDMVSKDYLPAIVHVMKDLAELIKLKETSPMEKDILAVLNEKSASAYEAKNALQDLLKQIEEQKDISKRALFCSGQILPAMNTLRALIDELEEQTERSRWPYPSYGDLTFSVR